MAIVPAVKSVKLKVETKKGTSFQKEIYLEIAGQEIKGDITSLKFNINKDSIPELILSFNVTEAIIGMESIIKVDPNSADRIMYDYLKRKFEGE